MPKIINNVKETILKATSDMLFSEGYSGVTLRKVARKSNIAVGTIYNYYQNKDTLIASVMLEDWQTALANMKKATLISKTAFEGIEAVYSEIKGFRDLYITIWDQFSTTGGMVEIIGERHKMLRDAVAEIVSGLLARFNIKSGLDFSRIIGNMVISCANQEDIGIDALKEVTEKLFEN